MTLFDVSQGRKAGPSKSMMDHPVVCLTPVLGIGALVASKLNDSKGRVLR